MERYRLVLVGAAAVLVAIVGGVWLTPDAGPPVAPSVAVDPVVVVPEPSSAAPDVPAAAAAAPAPRSDELGFEVTDEASFGLPSEPWDEGDPADVDDPAARQARDADRLVQLQKQLPEFMELVDAAEMCDTVPDAMHAQLDSLGGMVNEFAHEPDGGNAARGLALMQAYTPRLRGYLDEGGCE